MPRASHRNGARKPNGCGDDGMPPISTRADDPPEFVERVQDESRRKFGGTIEDIVSDPVLQDIAYSVLANGLSQPPKKIPDDVMKVVARMAEVGITVTPGTCDPRDLPEPVDLGISLTDAILEERYGSDRNS
jgi:hypothetical protein